MFSSIDLSKIVEIDVTGLVSELNFLHASFTKNSQSKNKCEENKKKKKKKSGDLD